MSTHASSFREPSVSVVSLGCSKNTVDSENLLGKIYYAGFKVISSPEDADAVIVNTCGFIHPAILETKSTIKDMIGLKKNSPNKKIIAMGCYVSRGEEDWKKNFPDLDGVFSLKDTESIVPHLQELFGYYNTRTETPLTYSRSISTTLPHYSYLKIAEGCSRTCTFCTIPSIRGQNQSKSIEELVSEAELLSNRGVKELILIAQDTTAYGLDLYQKPMLSKLLRKLSQVKGIEWLRLYYAYPDFIDDELIGVLLNEEKILHYLDLPIQHADPNVLKRMARRKTFNVFNNLFQKLRASDPNYCLRTTVIVGFPGETDEEFENLLSYIKTMKFDRLGAFKYMKENNTPAANMKEQVPDEVKEKRFEKLMLLQQKNHFEKNKTFIQNSTNVIIDQKSYDGSYIGRTFRDAPDIDTTVIVKSNQSLKAGDIVPVKITESKDYDLLGIY